MNLNLAWAVFGSFFLITEHAPMPVLVIWGVALVVDFVLDQRSKK